jgi:hypothetical protein
MNMTVTLTSSGVSSVRASFASMALSFECK